MVKTMVSGYDFPLNQSSEWFIVYCTKKAIFNGDIPLHRPEK